MKQTIQLRLGQSLTMTPQLQQAIRLLQLSTLDLQREIQEALDSNFMLEEGDEADRYRWRRRDRPQRWSRCRRVPGPGRSLAAAVQEQTREAPEEREFRPEETSMGDELPVDSQWDDTFESYLPSGRQGGDDNADYDPFAHRGSPLTLHDHLLWQLNLSRLDESDRAIATAVIDAISLDGYLCADIDELVATIASPEIGPDEVQAVVHQVQSFDPPGVARPRPAGVSAAATAPAPRRYPDAGRGHRRVHPPLPAPGQGRHGRHRPAARAQPATTWR